MSDVALSIVAPVFNEAAVVAELVRRCVLAGRAAADSFEVILVDDASSDDTPGVIESLCGDEVRGIRLDRNAGQFGATQAGLRGARGQLVVVLDGDLQDPPEVIPSLVSAMRDAGADADCVLAVKARRQDPLWFQAGRFAYHLLQRLMSRERVPSGAGSYCVMLAPVAARVGRLPPQRSNLAAVLAALGARTLTVPYEKARRYDDQSRVGFVGLAREALASLLLTGAVHRLLLLLAALFAMSGALGALPYATAAVLSASSLGAAGWCLTKRRAFLLETEHSG